MIGGLGQTSRNIRQDRVSLLPLSGLLHQRSDRLCGVTETVACSIQMCRLQLRCFPEHSLMSLAAVGGVCRLALEASHAHGDVANTRLGIVVFATPSTPHLGVVFVSLQNVTIRIFWEFCKKTLCLPNGLLLFGLLDFLRQMEGGLTLLRSSPHIIECFLLWLNYKIVPPRHCVSRGGHQRGLFFGKVEADLEPHATGFPVPRHLGKAIGHAMPGWDRPGMGRLMSEVFATWCSATSDLQPVLRRLGRVIGYTTFFGTCHDWQNGSQTCTLQLFHL